MPHLFATPQLDLEDDAVIAEVHAIRGRLASTLRAPRRWKGGLRRTAQARAIQGSNTIEGYTVTEQDAVAAVDHEPPLTTDQRTWAEILGYRRVLTYVLTVARSPGFAIDESTLRSMHFMLLEHDLSKGPGSYRPGDVYVHDDRSGSTVYEGPDADLVPHLMRELAGHLAAPETVDPLVRAAMAHLNLVMIHPFKDGNGRMARALQTMVLASDLVVEPEFSSIEEWLGNNTDDYYRVLAATGRGCWQPGLDAHLWVKFNLRAHHMQAQTVESRFEEAGRLWRHIDTLLEQHHLDDRVGDALFDALLGLRVTRPSYVRRTETEERTATRDLRRLVDADLPVAHGQTKGRFYVASRRLAEIRRDIRGSRRAVTDPFPSLADQLRRSS